MLDNGHCMEPKILLCIQILRLCMDPWLRNWDEEANLPR